MKRPYLLLYHFLFWTLWLLSEVAQHQARHSFERSAGQTLLISSAYLLITLTAFYGGYGLVYRSFIRYGWVGLGHVLTTLSLIVGMRYLVEFGFLKPLLNYDNYAVNAHFSWGWFVKNACLYYWNWVIYGTLFGFAQQYVRQQQRDREQMKAEVALLRAQVNPHFLFNALNDMYALTLTCPEQAPDALLKLSDLLRYVLYRSQSAAVPLTDEIAYVKSYIDLEQISQRGQAQVHAHIDGQISDQQIAPMLLIPFVENAFKHGSLFDARQPITITCQVEANQLLFRCCNAKRMGNKDATGGIGLANLRRRLELEYPGRHQLQILDSSASFAIHLTVTL
ncbi:sensor histidine kinase [Spirosoma radiotolerans]|uniref:sensor histidine kinase n=1 Tax=Spirosoma radiotolerans TaxID=1379870 RepID=UPI000696C5D5|nr:histidine kinase [Spirosoma radiotolerans]